MTSICIDTHRRFRSERQFHACAGLTAAPCSKCVTASLPPSVRQVCLEGEISKTSILDGLSRGKRAAGDLIPWNIAQQYQDKEFPQLSGARVVRIATHPDYQGVSSGTRPRERAGWRCLAVGLVRNVRTGLR